MVLSQERFHVPKMQQVRVKEKERELQRQFVEKERHLQEAQVLMEKKLGDAEHRLVTLQSGRLCL